MERKPGVGRLVPGRRGAALEHVDLGVFGREKVVVARLAPDAARAVHHVGGRHVRVDYGIGLRGAAAAAQAGDVLVGLREEGGRGGHGGAPGGGCCRSWGRRRVCNRGLRSGKGIGWSSTGDWHHAGNTAGRVGDSAGRVSTGTGSAGRRRARIAAKGRVGATTENWVRHLDSKMDVLSSCCVGRR